MSWKRKKNKRKKNCWPGGRGKRRAMCDAAFAFKNFVEAEGGAGPRETECSASKGRCGKKEAHLGSCYHRSHHPALDRAGIVTFR